LWLAVPSVLAVIVYVKFGWLSLPLCALVLLLLFLFRDPARKIPSAPLGVVSSVCGRVERVLSVRDDYLQRNAICVTINMGLTSVYSLRSPMEGKIVEQWLAVPSKIISSDTPHSGANKTFAQWIQSDEGDDVVMVVEATLLTPRPRCYAHSGERIGQGQRCGYLRFGSRVHVLLPESARVAVRAGDQVTAGTDIIATLVHAAVSPPQIVVA